MNRFNLNDHGECKGGNLLKSSPGQKMTPNWIEAFQSMEVDC